MYRLLGFNSVTNARLLLNRKKIVENNRQNFSLLFNSENVILKAKSKLISSKMIQLL